MSAVASNVDCPCERAVELPGGSNAAVASKVAWRTRTMRDAASHAAVADVVTDRTWTRRDAVLIAAVASTATAAVMVRSSRRRR